MNLRNVLLKTIFGFAILGVGLGAGYAWGFSVERKALVTALDFIHPVRDHVASYKFIAPLLAYIIPPAEQEPELVLLKNKISNIIESEKKTGGLIDASMFFSDLNRGRVMGVNEKQKYNPASMLKVVVMVSYFKQAEANPAILEKKLTYTSTTDAELKRDQFNSLSELEIGKSYDIYDLIEKMITDSDNGAEVLLFDNIDKKDLNAIYNALNIQSPDDIDSDFVLSPRAYSLFFRIIYSSTYLSRDLSEKALAILSRTTFDDGIIAGLPTNLVVSHKFGERVISKDGQVRNVELHDCGIVYYPENPYFLCVMTKGKDAGKLRAVIKDISSMVYESYGIY